MDITFGDKVLKNLASLNVVLGKNGSGKSSILKEIDQALTKQNGTHWGKIKYITPERAGTLQYDANTEQNIINNLSWLQESRRVNQFDRFKHQTVSQYRNLELMVLREIESSRRDDKGYTFKLYLNRINALLDQVEFKPEGNTFSIYRKGTTNKIDSRSISSGESELICLAIECLVFERECLKGKENVLLLDEPDVHLHPDLQMRLINLIKEGIQNEKHTVLIATHSTAILGALDNHRDCRVTFMRAGQKEFNFKSVLTIYKKVLPVFGAHPLSNIFNEMPIFLVEGEDDERIWQRAVRVAQGKMKLYPCSCEGIGNMNDMESELQQIIPAIYDDPKAFSLRDRDETSDEGIDDLPSITRFRLSCRSAENLLLSNEVLQSLGINWDDLKIKIQEWLNNNQKHPHQEIMNQFVGGGFDRKIFNIKAIRNDLMGIIGTDLDWEIAVGKVIGNLIYSSKTALIEEGSIFNFLGEKIVDKIIRKN